MQTRRTKQRLTPATTTSTTDDTIPAEGYYTHVGLLTALPALPALRPSHRPLLALAPRRARTIAIVARSRSLLFYSFVARIGESPVLTNTVHSKAPGLPALPALRRFYRPLLLLTLAPRRARTIAIVVVLFLRGAHRRESC